jgi:hypothetical protein
MANGQFATKKGMHLAAHPWQLFLATGAITGS